MKRVPADLYDANTFLPLPGCSWYEEMDESVRSGVNWVDHCYKGGHPYLFRVENKTHLGHYVDTIYRLADRRQYATMARLIPREVARGLARRLPFRRRSDPALSRDDKVAVRG